MWIDWRHARSAAFLRIIKDRALFASSLLIFQSPQVKSRETLVYSLYPLNGNNLHRRKTPLAFKLGDLDFDTRAGIGRRGFGNIASQLRRSTSCVDISASYLTIITYVASRALTNDERPARVRDCGRHFGVHIWSTTEAERPRGQLERLPRRTLLVQVLVAMPVKRWRARQAAGVGSSHEHLDHEIDIGLRGEHPGSLERLSCPLDLCCDCVKNQEG